MTLSPCLTDVIPAIWPSPCIPSARPDPAALERLGISLANAIAAEKWAEERSSSMPTEWPVPFAAIDDLHVFVDRFVARDANVLLLGVSLPSDVVAAFLAQGAEGSVSSERYHAVRRALGPADGADVLGFEVLGNGMNEAHSIVCTGGEVGLHRALGIELNASGLIDSLDGARRAAEWASADSHGEPVRYFPWRLTRYRRR